jgi:hypothetical protein
MIALRCVSLCDALCLYNVMSAWQRNLLYFQVASEERWLCSS